MEKSAGFISTSGVQMPPMIYGTAWKKERTAELVYDAVKSGFRGIDTACQPKHYHEIGVGQALQRLASEGITRESLFVQTKYTPVDGQDPRRVPYDPEASLSQQVAQSFAASCRNLGTDYIDSLVLHSPLFPYIRLAEVWQAMEKIARDGGAKQLGISNCYDLNLLRKLYDEADVKPAVVQNRFYADSGYDTELRAWCREQGIVYQSFWTLTANPHILAAMPLLQIAANHDKIVVQVFFNYLNRCGVIPLNGTTSPMHMASDLQSFDFSLSEEEIESITALLI